MTGWLCRRGLHAWQGLVVSAVRDGALGPLCSVTARCARCPAVRHEQNRPLPRRHQGAAA